MERACRRCRPALSCQAWRSLRSSGMLGMVPSTQHIPLGGHRMPRKESLASFSQPDQDRRIMAAWERFLQNGALASSTVRRLIERSWERCRAAGIDPVLTQAAAPLLDEELTALRSRYRDLLEASVPIMAQAREILSESGTIMILTDPSGVILQTEGDPATVDAARLIRLQIGASWPAARTPLARPCPWGGRCKSTPRSISALASSPGPVPPRWCVTRRTATSSPYWMSPDSGGRSTATRLRSRWPRPAASKNGCWGGSWNCGT